MNDRVQHAHGKAVIVSEAWLYKLTGPTVSDTLAASPEAFKQDAFSMANLTAAINKLPYKPARIGQLGLFGEIAFLTLVGGIASNDSREITLTPKGRYLLLVMMRETLALSNDARDQARAELPLEERILLLEGDTSALLHLEPSLAAG